MLRKFLISFLLTSAGLFVAAGVATAAPPYEAPEPVSVAVSLPAVAPGAPFAFSGEGFLPGESIVITVFYNGPSGLRATPALAAAAAESTVQTTVADGAGNFAVTLTLTQPGVYTLTATGQTSGRSSSTTTTVESGSSPAGGTQTTTVPPGNGTGLAYTGQGNGTASGGLAYTGTSVAGPIAIGAAALLAGLALLFFGTRGVIRRNVSGPADAK